MPRVAEQDERSKPLDQAKGGGKNGGIARRIDHDARQFPAARGLGDLTVGKIFI